MRAGIPERRYERKRGEPSRHSVTSMARSEHPSKAQSALLSQASSEGRAFPSRPLQRPGPALRKRNCSRFPPPSITLVAEVIDTLTLKFSAEKDLRKEKFGTLELRDSAGFGLVKSTVRVRCHVGLSTPACL